MLQINQKLVPAGAKNNPNKNMPAVDYITIHNTGNYEASATAKMHVDYQYNGSGGREASWHYTVDADSVWQSFDDRRMCWHAGDGAGPGNTTSIGIEICVNDKANFARACDNAAQLAAALLHRHGLTVDRVVQHNHWSGKNCPAEIRSGVWGVTWEQFLQAVRTYFAPPVPDADTPSSWAVKEGSWQWAIAAGVTDGKRPKATCTREEVAAMIYRAVGHKG